MKRQTVFTNVKGLTQVWAILNNNYSQFTIEGGKKKHKSDLGFTTLTFFHLREEEYNISSAMATYNSNEQTLSIKKSNGNKLKKFAKRREM